MQHHEAMNENAPLTVERPVENSNITVRPKRLRSGLIKKLIMISLPVLLVVCNSKSVTVTDEDKKYIKAFAREWRVDLPAERIHKSFETEVQFIAAAQQAVMRSIRHEEVGHDVFGNVSFYYQKRTGFCYDRAVLMEKFFAHYGFPFRHAYLYFGEKGEDPGLLNLLKKSNSSHALLEVKTKKGWMAVGTNADWIGLTKQGNLLSVQTLHDTLQLGELHLKSQPLTGVCFWQEKGNEFGYVYGLYSRHGGFFKNANWFLALFSILPDYHLPSLFSNF